MKIGILTNTYPPNLNGVSLAVKNLEAGLRAKGHEVFVATPKVIGVEYRPEVFAIDSIPTKEKVSPDLYIPILYIQKATEFFRQKEVELIHTHDIFIGGSEGIVIAANLGVPCIHTFHTFIESYPYWWVPYRRKIIRTHIKLVCNNYDHVIAPSVKVYRYLAQIGFKTPVTQMLNVIDNKHLVPIESNKVLAKKIGFKPTDFVFITFCRVAHEKSVDIGLVVLHQLIKKYKNIKYLICGQGPEIENLKTLAGYLGISDKVIFTRRYEQNELSGLASLAKVFLFTSHTENLPTNLLEAMKLSLPVISVDDEAVDYLLDPGINGFKGSVDEMSQYAEKLYLDKKLLQNMSENALERAKKIENEDVTQEHVELYQKVLKYYKNKDIDPGVLETQITKISSLVSKSIQKIFR